MRALATPRIRARRIILFFEYLDERVEAAHVPTGGHRVPAFTRRAADVSLRLREPGERGGNGATPWRGVESRGNICYLLRMVCIQ